jgi:hypothetical protein
MKQASVCKWDLEFQFKEEIQVKEFFRILMEQENLIYDFSCETGLTDSSQLHTVTISGSWANNLSAIAKILETVDYKGVN